MEMKIKKGENKYKNKRKNLMKNYLLINSKRSHQKPTN